LLQEANVIAETAMMIKLFILICFYLIINIANR
jgi:hypothetical protein